MIIYHGDDYSDQLLFPLCRITEMQKATQRKRVSSDSSVAEALAHSDSFRTAKPALSRLDTHTHTVILSDTSTQVYETASHSITWCVTQKTVFIVVLIMREKMYECASAVLVASE